MDGGIFLRDSASVTTEALISHQKSFQGVSILFFHIKVLFTSC